MATETLRTDRLRNDKEAREGPPTLSIGTSHPKASCWRMIVALFDLSLLAQSQQSTACQALHQVENRAARWLMQCRRRLGSNDIRLTQEFFGQMLGVQRTTINLVERTLRNAGLIQMGRGRISIVDAKGLEAVSCDCYERIERPVRGAAGSARLDFFPLAERNRRALGPNLGPE